MVDSLKKVPEEVSAVLLNPLNILTLPNLLTTPDLQTS